MFFEGWRRNGKKEVVRLKVGDVNGKNNLGAEGWRRNGKSPKWSG